TGRLTSGQGWPWIPTAPIDTREEKLVASWFETRAKYRGKPQGRPVGTNHLNSSVRTREYLTTAEIERLMAAARKSSRYGHRDATMILIGYRHGVPRPSMRYSVGSGLGPRCNSRYIRTCCGMAAAMP